MVCSAICASTMGSRINFKEFLSFFYLFPFILFFFLSFFSFISFNSLSFLFSFFYLFSSFVSLSLEVFSVISDQSSISGNVTSPVFFFLMNILFWNKVFNAYQILFLTRTRLAPEIFQAFKYYTSVIVLSS